ALPPPVAHPRPRPEARPDHPNDDHPMTSIRSRGATLLFAAALLAPPATLAAQESGTVAGRALMAAGTPAADLIVRVEGTTRGALTDADGRFQITAVPAGARVLVAQRVGLATVREAVTVPAGGTVTVALTLTAQATV